MKNSIWAVALILSCVACSSTYTCQSYPTGGCKTVSDVYKESNGKVTKKTDSSYNDTPILLAPASGASLLQGPQVLRIYMNNWEDDDGDLHTGGYIYVKVRDSKWNI